MTTHVTWGGHIRPVAKKFGDNEKLPDDAVLVSYYAKLVRPNGSYIDAPTCTLHHIPGTGYVASDIRPASE